MNIVINLVNTAVQSPFFYCERIVLIEDLVFEGESNHLAVLTLNNSPITRLVALKGGSAWQLAVSVTLNSVRQTKANVCALH